MPEDDTADSRPTPDPTSLTTDAVERAIKAERDYETARLDVIRERLNGIDKATRVLDETVTRVPTEVQKEVAHLRELALEKFQSVATQFKERDNRSERESKDNKTAVDAAFAAADKAADERNKSNMLAIAKTEIAMAETINKLEQLFKATTDGLATMITANAITLNSKLDDLKERVGKIENLKLGASEQVHSSQSSISQFLAVLGAVVAIVSIAVAVMLATRNGGG